MTFSITKTYRQKTKEVAGLCKRRGVRLLPWTVAANSNSNEPLGSPRIDTNENGLSSDFKCQTTIDIMFMWGVIIRYIETQRPIRERCKNSKPLGKIPTESTLKRTRGGGVRVYRAHFIHHPPPNPPSVKLNSLLVKLICLANYGC